MPYLALFRMPTPVTISGRSSSITNSFINGIIPVIRPTAAEVERALTMLGMTLDTFQCAYCGDGATEWDHLRPLVVGKRPTGYISEIHNLIPACGKCNQSKGNKDWELWMRSEARLSPKVRGVANLEARIARIRAYAEGTSPTKMDFESIVGKEVWAQHWANCEALHAQMKDAQGLAKQISETIAKAYRDAL